MGCFEDFQKVLHFKGEKLLTLDMGEHVDSLAISGMQSHYRLQKPLCKIQKASVFPQ